MIKGALLDKTAPRHSLACYLDLPFQMDPFYHNPSPCLPPLQADPGDQISSLTYSSSCSASSFVHSFNLNHKIEGMDEHQDQALDDHDCKQEDDKLSLSRDTYNEDHQTQMIHSSSFKLLIHESSGHGVLDGAGKQYNSGPPGKWMSSKMRLMKKMLSTDHQAATSSRVFTNKHASRMRQRSPVQDHHDDSSGNSPNKIRVCSDCNTTKTPLWRSGPQGPKSLCNACGIRQRKARRAMAAAAADGGLLSTSYAISNKLIKEKRHGCTRTNDHKMTQYKKRCKLGSQRSKKKINFDDFKMSLSKSSAFQQVFPQEYEIKEAAILLMALSCGLVQG